ICHYILLFFFFQAEDGIRDATVTGVQTCALPILPACPWSPPRPKQDRESSQTNLPILARPNWVACSPRPSWIRRVDLCATKLPRSEERRVGKECRSQRSA